MADNSLIKKLSNKNENKNKSHQREVKTLMIKQNLILTNKNKKDPSFGSFFSPHNRNRKTYVRVCVLASILALLGCLELQGVLRPRRR